MTKARQCFMAALPILDQRLFDHTLKCVAGSSVGLHQRLRRHDLDIDALDGSQDTHGAHSRQFEDVRFVPLSGMTSPAHATAFLEA